MLTTLPSETIEDSHMARTVADQIDNRNQGFDHYLTLQLDNRSGPDSIDYSWRTVHVGVRSGDLYIAERSNGVEGVAIISVKRLQSLLNELATRKNEHWANASADIGDTLEDLHEHGEVAIPTAIT